MLRDLLTCWLLRRPRILLVMHLDDMRRVHPQMDTSHVCAKCGGQVGIYPSGQQVLKAYRHVKIICNRCADGLTGTLAPGALAESLQSRWR